MNMESVLGIVRHALTFGAGLLVAKGYIAETEVVAIVGALVLLIGTVWSVFNKRGL